MICGIGIGLISAGAQPLPASGIPNQCFSSREFESWRAGDAKTIYIRVRSRRYYRLDLQNQCPQLLWPDAHLITKFHGSDRICSAIDWNLQVTEAPPSIPTPCIVKKMTELSPAEVAALPIKSKP
jgi:hypothetical protein